MPGQPKTQFKKASKDAIKLERRSEGFLVTLSIDLSKKPSRAKCGFPFIDALLGGIPYFNVGLKIQKRSAKDDEVIRNAGYAFGEALRRLWEKRRGKINGVSIHSDGKAMCMFAIKVRKDAGEANMQVIGAPERGFKPDRFFLFFEGLAEGMKADVSMTANLTKEKSQLKLISKTMANSLKQVLQ